MRKIIWALMMLMMLTISASCAREDTPETALEEIKQSLEERDYEKFSARVDVRELLDAAYDDSTLELARRVEKFGAAYPDDSFFRNRGEDILLYNELHRDEHMKFVRAVISCVFDRGLEAPTDFDADTISGTASELRHYCESAQSKLESSVVEGDRASMRLRVNVESLYAREHYELPVELEFEKEGERWRLHRVGNVGEMMPILVDIAEILWPDQFNF